MRARLLSFLVLGSIALGGAGCSRQRYATIVGKKVVNDPRNKSLRFDLLRFGIGEFCREMTTRGIPLRLRDDQPVLGRFFADSCSTQRIDQDARKSLIVQFSGRGYAWVRDTQRIGVTAAGVVEFAPDFQVYDRLMYVYFRPRNVQATSLELSLVESGLARAAVSTLGVPVEAIGQHVVNSQLQRGFTVIRHDRTGEVEFGFGLVPKGEHPFKPFVVEHSDKLTLANDRTEVHAGQQDYVGAFEVEKNGQTLWITLSLDGAPGADVAVVPKAYGDQMIGTYTTQPGPARLAAQPFVEEAFGPGQLYRRAVSLPRGYYYLVLDNSAALGPTTPAPTPADDRAAKIDYLIQRGRKP